MSSVLGLGLERVCQIVGGAQRKRPPSRLSVPSSRFSVPLFRFSVPYLDSAFPHRDSAAITPSRFSDPHIKRRLSKHLEEKVAGNSKKFKISPKVSTELRQRPFPFFFFFFFGSSLVFWGKIPMF